MDEDDTTRYVWILWLIDNRSYPDYRYNDAAYIFDNEAAALEQKDRLIEKNMVGWRRHLVITRNLIYSDATIQ